uniref:Nucleotide-diphospho-sugar transferase domain-containing protein n=1 Tax=Setaria viridis TaxID=4556 RepID=A0A4U6UQ60_SETVI|nr:hypothetical protein SEVIR_5G436200v2 [Setaria viridis]
MRDISMGRSASSFRNGEGIEHLLNHTPIIAVAVDAGGFDRPLQGRAPAQPHCYLLEVRSANVSAANLFLSKGCLELVWAKLSLQQRVLELGYNYLFTVGTYVIHLTKNPSLNWSLESLQYVQDVDVMWFRDPFRHINLYADVTMSSDHFSGKPESLKNTPNTGFYYVKSTDRTVEMLRCWRAARSRFPPHHDQTVFDKIKRELAGKVGVRIAFLDTALFGTFCELRDGIDGGPGSNYKGLAPAEKKSGNKARWAYPRAEAL